MITKVVHKTAQKYKMCSKNRKKTKKEYKIIPYVDLVKADNQLNKS